MRERSRRTEAIADWFRELSALLAIFPFVDELLRPGSFRWGLIAAMWSASLISLAVGLSSMHEDRW